MAAGDQRPSACEARTRSSPTRRQKRPAFPRAASRSARARLLLPAPDAPRMRIPASPKTTALAWMRRPAPAVRRSARLRSPRRPQPDDEAGAENAALAVGALWGEAVHRADAAAMRLDDLARDRQAEAGILAEALIGPIGIKTLENALEGIGGNARPVIVDDDLEAVASGPVRGAPLAGRKATRTLPPGCEKDLALSIRLLNTWPRRESWPRTMKCRSCAPSSPGACARYRG